MQGFREKLQGLENLAASARAGRYQPTVPVGGTVRLCSPPWFLPVPSLLL